MAGRQMQLEDWLDDLCVRFVINLPQEDLSSVARICFQVEEAQWFYEDFIRPLDPTLPSMSLRTFCLRIFQHCPLLASFSVENHVQAFEEFIQYKTRVPVRGAIMLNSAMDSVVLVKGWKKGANWSFPRGKINKDEDDLDCAVREVYEETGLDLREAGLVPKEAKPKYIEIPMREQHLRLYVIRDVPMDTNFQPRTRKEISKIEWYKLSELPTLRKKGSQNGPQYDSSGPGINHNKFYMVAPFLVPLKKWIVSQKKVAEKRAAAADQYPSHPLSNHLPIEEEPTGDEAWAPEAAGKVPTIDSLDGATRELQRLLNVQPKVEAAPAPAPPPAENKASALLSLLQPASAAGHPSQAAPSQVPRPPADPNAAGEFNYTTPSPYPGFNAAPQTFVPNPGPLAQHLPPPRYMQAPSAFGGAPQASLAQAPAQNYPSVASYQTAQLLAQPHLPPVMPRQAPLQGQALALLNAFKQGPPPSAPLEPREQRESQQPAQAAPSQHADSQFTSPYSQYATPSGAPTSHPEPKNPGELVGSIVGPARQEQHKSALLDLFKAQTAEASSDRSKGKEPVGRKKVVFDPNATPAERSLLAQLQNTSLASKPREALQAPPHSERPQAQAQAQDQPPANHLHPDDVPADRTTRKREKRGTVPKPASGPSPGHPKQGGRSPRNTAPTASNTAATSRNSKPGPQPTRILQRGQSLQSLRVAEPSAAAPEPSAAPTSPAFALHSGGAETAGRSLHASASATVSATATAGANNAFLAIGAAGISPSSSVAQQKPAQPPNMHPQPQQQQQQQAFPTPNYQADVSQEQKRQLLSLFGAGPAPQVPRQQEPKGSGAGSSTGEKAISQADQSFLLDYLQSVTNNAAGR
ncbi:mRNA decapping complex subunit 2 [Escovopsis weberi]|uniref:mRNA decapping complex subunit 2 n=1 Tax=Escovopsis weberi TaxID=150374 RepID=A0A0M8MXV6_ESCWE|nr:mRNA decapping complex subunit 2 [Escovopsis weberi]